MIRLTLISLLAGGAALLLVLTMLFPPPAPMGDVVSQTLASAAQESQLVVGDSGGGHIEFALTPARAADYAFLHLSVRSSSPDYLVSIAWAGPDGQWRGREILENATHRPVWLTTAELPHWSGDLEQLQLAVLGPPGTTVAIDDLSLHPTSPTRQLRAIYSDFAGFLPWRRAAMNTHTGITPLASFYPIPLTVGLLGLSIAAYGLILLAARGRLRADIRVVALIFLACWLLPDALWQKRLLHQLSDTHRQFAGKTTEEQLAVGPDAELYRLVSTMKTQIGEPDARVFVASNDDYSGLRVAYYLYPLNVYWVLRGPKLPPVTELRSGDYIALVKPTPGFARQNQLLLHGQPPLPVEPLLRDRRGSLYRVP